MKINITRIVRGHQMSDGAGVQLKRFIGTSDLDMHDPFLLFDVFGSEKPQDYIAGFPPHPHRGFETVTYMFAGKMRHEDSAGHAGVINTGDVQWMSAASGIIHSEMPEQTHGRLAGVQLWLNLPAAEKMSAPKYQEYPAEHIPIEVQGDVTVKAIANATGAGMKAAITTGTVSPLYLHVTMKAGAVWQYPVPQTHHSLIYVISGALEVGETLQTLSAGELAVLSQGDELLVEAAVETSFLLIAARPIGEPVARGGPFVMNTQMEIEQAFDDYKQGRLATYSATV